MGRFVTSHRLRGLCGLQAAAAGHRLSRGRGHGAGRGAGLTGGGRQEGAGAGGHGDRGPGGGGDLDGGAALRDPKREGYGAFEAGGEEEGALGGQCRIAPSYCITFILRFYIVYTYSVLLSIT